MGSYANECRCPFTYATLNGDTELLKVMTDHVMSRSTPTARATRVIQRPVATEDTPLLSTTESTPNKLAHDDHSPEMVFSLVAAIRNGQVGVVNQFLSMGVDVNFDFDFGGHGSDSSFLRDVASSG